VAERLDLFKDKQLIVNGITIGVNIFLVLFLLNLLANNIIIAESSFVFVICFYILIAFMLFNLPFKRMYEVLVGKNKIGLSQGRLFVWFLFIFLSFVILLSSRITMLWFISVSLVTSGLFLVLNEFKIQKKELFLLTFFSFVYALFFIFLQTVPVLRGVINQLSSIFSGGIGSLLGGEMSFGPSISGLWIVVFFFLFSISLFSFYRCRKRVFILYVVGLLVIWIFYLIVLSFFVADVVNVVVFLNFILFMAYLIYIFIYLFRYEIGNRVIIIPKYQKTNVKSFLKNVVLWALVFLFLSSFIITITPESNKSENKGTVLFYCQNQYGDWQVPNYGLSYSDRNWGMFGVLPFYLSISGYNVKMVVDDEENFLESISPYTTIKNNHSLNLPSFVEFIETDQITDDLFDDVDVFVVINLYESFSFDEQKNIWGFIEDGGSLLVLGDHTNLSGTQCPLNNLLDPVGIRFNFDAALSMDPTVYNWRPTNHLMHHPITQGINDFDEILINVGASLDISPSANPVITGRYGFSDRGNNSNVEEAFLGDLIYKPGEQIGDVTLAASAYYGNGKVLVFGDTNTFLNPMLTYTHPFIDNVFIWLNSGRTGNLELLQIVSSVILIMVSFVLFVKFKKNSFYTVFFPLMICFGLICSTSINPYLMDDIQINGSIAYIDLSHGERFNIDYAQNTSIVGLMFNLDANGFLPLLLRDFSKEDIENSKILVFNAPTKSFNDDEICFIKNYMNNGGVVLLCTGYDDKEASMPLLNELSLDIRDIPLGRVDYDAGYNDPIYVNAWPILINNPGSTESFYNITTSGFTYNVVTFTQYGNGGLVLIADGQFILEKNLKDYPGNVKFLLSIIDVLRERGMLT